MHAHLDPAWVGVHAVERIAEAIGRPCTVLNDADAAGLAEMRTGVGVGRRGVVLMLTLGTGVGSALFVDGHLVPNTEFGHIEIRGRAGEARAAASVRERKGWTWEEWSVRVNEYLDRIDRLVWPDLVILGGGVTKEADAWLPLLRCRPPLMVASLRNSAGIVGAAMRAFDEESVHGTPVSTTSTADAPGSGSSVARSTL
ncbi:MAG TPA: ROK family protein [Miltoncostaeaceae bacterium]|nr:ROK family protein [Miltoncostaeaceae bacterium]